MLQRLALYATLGLVLDALGQSVTTAGFWSVVALFWAAEQLTRVEVVTAIEQELRTQRKKQQEDNSNGQQ